MVRIPKMLQDTIVPEALIERLAKDKQLPLSEIYKFNTKKKLSRPIEEEI